MNLKQVAGLSLAIVAMIITIIAMATQGWYVVSVDSSDSTITNTKSSYGLLTYTISASFKSGSVVTTTGNIKDLDTNMGKLLVAGGNTVLALGSISLVLCLIGVVFSILHISGRSAVSRLYVGVVFFLLGTAMIIAAIFLYSKKVFIGYSLHAFLASGCIFVIAKGVLISIAASTNPRMKQVVTATAIVVGMIIAILAMATSYWWVFDFADAGSYNISYANVLRFGLKTYVLSFTNSSPQQSGSLSSFNGLYTGFSRFVDGGNVALGTGIVALLFAVASLIYFIWAIMRSKTLIPVGVLLVMTSAFIFAGVVSYAKAAFVGFSFLLFFGSSFMLLIACFIIIRGSFQANSSSKETEVTGAHQPILDSNSESSAAGGTPDYYEPPTN